MKLPLLLFLWFPTLVCAQNGPKAEDFRTASDAFHKGNACFQLTYEVDWSSGSIWYKKPISLKDPFEMEMNIMLGCKDEDGADGMVFVFHPEPVANGYRGEGMGFGGLIPSLGIEIDTWENEHLGDPPQDHIALLQQGSVNHFYNLKGPIKVPNLETCEPNQFKIGWNPSKNTLSISINGTPYLNYQGDIIEEVFFGISKVYWGVTSATGRYNNRHEICFEKLDFVQPLEDLRFDLLFSNRLLEGESTPMRALQFEWDTEKIMEEAYPELFRIINLLEENTEMHIDITSFTHSQSKSHENQTLSEDRAEEIAQFLIKHGIKKDRVHHRGLGDKFPLESENSRMGLRKNERIEIQIYKPKA